VNVFKKQKQNQNKGTNSMAEGIFSEHRTCCNWDFTGALKWDYVAPVEEER